MKSKINIFMSGYVQVFLVSGNVYSISENLYIMIFVFSFLISLFWSQNVKNISNSTIKIKIIYSFGAALGSISGVIVLSVIHNC